MSEETKHPSPSPTLKPSEFMRARRPELFSDTAPIAVQKLDGGYLEYYLETLTNRKQEQVFEEFARRLVEAEICPNVKPQTGPTGGGDSKTDASTYPVSPELASRCWWGSPAPPSGEKWAFAFSCKKTWKSKLVDDMGKIAALSEGYAKAFFITNQFTRDKDRAQQERTLGKQHGFEVHVLDRTWIVKSVIEHRREDIAIQALGIQGAEQQKPVPGPRDLSRQRQLDALLDALKDAAHYHGNDYAMAQDYQHSGKLSRALGRPRHETDGLFSRARDLAANTGYAGLIIRVAYDHAWTSFWWFDDAAPLARIYSDIERHLPDTPDPELCELFANLWRLLHNSVLFGYLSPEVARLDERARQIRTELTRLAADRRRPNAALQAETELHLLDLHPPFDDRAQIQRSFDGLRRCLKRSIGLGMYPAMKFMDTLRDAGEFLGELPGYDSLFDEIRRVAKKRLGETAEGRLLFERGMQLVGKRRSGEVLRMLGQARVRLFKQETMREALRATLACSDAYGSMGLYWAARAEAITAAHAALRTPEAADEFPVEGALAAIRMGWLELALARIAPFLAWHQLTWSLVDRLRSMQFDPASLEEELQTQEGVLGCMFLNLPQADLQSLEQLEGRLNDLGLPMARLALLYGLSRSNEVLDEWPDESGDRQAKMNEFFAAWREQPAAEQTPHHLPGETSVFSRYQTTVLGVRYSIEVKNGFGPLLFAENLLGVIEAALALARWENLAFIVDEVRIRIDVSGSGVNPPPFEPPAPPAPQVYDLCWRPDMLEWLNGAERGQVVDYFRKALLSLLLATTIDPLEDLLEELDRWDEEDTFGRALGTSPISHAATDLLREEHYDLRYWCQAASSPPV